LSCNIRWRRLPNTRNGKLFVQFVKAGFPDRSAEINGKEGPSKGQAIIYHNLLYFKFMFSLESGESLCGCEFLLGVLM
jgi:hypothetical protein